MNKKQLTGNAKNRRQHEITDVLLSFYDTIDNEFRLFKEDDNNNNSHFNSIFKHKIEKSAGRFWCYYSSFIPLFILFYAKFFLQ